MCKIDHKEASGEVACDATGKAISGVWKLGEDPGSSHIDSKNKGLIFMNRKGK